MLDKNEIKRNYKETHRPMGVYKIHNTVNNKIFVGSSLNIPARINRHKMALETGIEEVTDLLNDYKKYGSDKFSFDVIDYLEPKDDPSYNYKEEIALLEEMWLEKLQPYDEKGYNLRGRKHYFKP